MLQSEWVDRFMISSVKLHHTLIKLAEAQENRKIQLARIHPIILAKQSPYQYMVHLGSTEDHFCVDQKLEIINIFNQHCVTYMPDPFTLSPIQPNIPKRGRKKQKLVLPQELLDVEQEVNEKWNNKTTQKKLVQVKKRIRKTELLDKSSKCTARSNEWKNVPKNFGKACINWILPTTSLHSNIQTIYQILNEQSLVARFISRIGLAKISIQNIQQLYELIKSEDSEEPLLNSCFRILFYAFLKNHAVCYIYNSRITRSGWHLAHRRRMLAILKCPALLITNSYKLD